MSGVDDIQAAYAAAERLARRHYENFPVASRMLPRPMRPHVAAVYAFARTADDFADEGDVPAEERLRRLDDWHRRLRACTGTGLSTAAGARPAAGVATGATDREAASVFLALGHTIRACRLPVPLFEDLLSAFRQDVTKPRYADFEELLDYCRRSANPVGRLVLRIAGHDDPRLDASSDCLCTALQLTNFWQDLAVDWRRGRLYVPREESDRAGAREADLDADRLTPAWADVLGAMAGRTRRFFEAGRSVGDLVPGRLGLELRLTWLGGVRVLDRVERVGFDVFRRRPSLGARDVLPIVARLAGWRLGRPRGSGVTRGAGATRSRVDGGRP